MGWDAAGEPSKKKSALEILRSERSAPGPVRPETSSSLPAESPGISEVAIVSALQNQRYGLPWWRSG